MFSVGYFNKAMVINTTNIRRIDLQNVEKLRRLVIQLLSNPCGKLILDFNGVKFIDTMAFEMINRLHNLAIRQNVVVEFTNINEELLELFELIPKAKDYKVVERITTETQILEEINI